MVAKASVKTATETAMKTKASAAKPKATSKAGAVPDPRIGTPFPAFQLPATLCGEVSSKVLRGKPYILYFYPKDDTSGCTAEACGFCDALPAFAKLKATVIGVSRDSLASHEKFSRKYDLSFPLASDAEGVLSAALGVWVEKSMYGRKYMGMERSTFLVDAEGIIRAVWRKVSVPGHVDTVHEALVALG